MKHGKDKKPGHAHRKKKRRKKILSGEASSLWMSLGPSSGPSEISLICRSKPVDHMATSEVISDTMNFVLVLAWRAKQKRDGEALHNLVFASKTINRLIESLEKTHTDLFNFASEQSEWPVNLSPKQQMVDAAVTRLQRLKIGSKSVPPTWRGVQVESGNWATRIAAELIRRLNAFRSLQLSGNKALLPPLLASLNKSRVEELGEMPELCADLHKLKPLGPRTWKSWWPYAAAILDSLWKQHPELFDKCLELDFGAWEWKDTSSVRRNYLKRHIRQAFASIAKNLGKQI
jgi:hypothetical protein